MCSVLDAWCSFGVWLIHKYVRFYVHFICCFAICDARKCSEAFWKKQILMPDDGRIEGDEDNDDDPFMLNISMNCEIMPLDSLIFNQKWHCLVEMTPKTTPPPFTIHKHTRDSYCLHTCFIGRDVDFASAKGWYVTSLYQWYSVVSCVGVCLCVGGMMLMVTTHFNEHRDKL